MKQVPDRLLWAWALVCRQEEVLQDKLQLITPSSICISKNKNGKPNPKNKLLELLRTRGHVLIANSKIMAVNSAPTAEARDRTKLHLRGSFARTAAGKYPKVRILSFVLLAAISFSSFKEIYNHGRRDCFLSLP